MRHTSITLAICAAFLVAGQASASYTIDLIWSDTGTKTLTITTPGDPTAAASGACAGGFLSAGLAGRCLEVRLTAAASITAAIVTLGWDAAASGLAVESTSFTFSHASPVPCLTSPM